MNDELGTRTAGALQTTTHLITESGIEPETDRLVGIAVQTAEGKIVIVPLQLHRSHDYQIHWVAEDKRWSLKQRKTRRAHRP